MLQLKKTYLILLLIIFFSLFIRVINLEKTPNGLYIDEAQFGYDAYSILKTGRDHHGKFLPFYFEGFGYGVNAVYIYSLIPFIKILDLTVFSIRFVSALWGVLIVIGTFFLSKEFFNEKVGLISSFLVSISPWAFQYSRIAFEVITTLPFVIFGILFLFKGVKKRYNKQIFLGSLLLAFSTYTYATAKLFSPLLFFGFLMIYQNFFKKHKKLFLIAIITFSITILPVLYHTFFNIGNLRFETVSIFEKEFLNQYKNQLNSKYGYTPGLNLLIKNNYFVYSYIFLKNYLSHISLNFLFLTGDQNLRHSIRSFGQLFIFELPLILGGLILIFKDFNKINKLILIWLILFPVASSITKEAVPHASRTFVAIPVFQIISGVFIFNLFNWIKFNLRRFCPFKKTLVMILLILYIIGIFINVSLYFYNYFFIYPKYSASSWDYGYTQIVDFIHENKKYDKIVTFCCNWGYMEFLFLEKYNPSDFQKCGVNSFFVYNDNCRYKICDLDKCNQIPGNNLYIAESSNVKTWLEEHPEFKIVKKIFYPDGTETFYLIENSKFIAIDG